VEVGDAMGMCTFSFLGNGFRSGCGLFAGNDPAANRSAANVFNARFARHGSGGAGSGRESGAGRDESTGCRSGSNCCAGRFDTE
jgi:hypothetical protein